jgi:hypothetical protein
VTLPIELAARFQTNNNTTTMKNTTTIKKQFQTIKQAERYQERLYNKYDSVNLKSFPMFQEQGTYTWEVK